MLYAEEDRAQEGNEDSETINSETKQNSVGGGKEGKRQWGIEGDACRCGQFSHTDILQVNVTLVLQLRGGTQVKHKDHWDFPTKTGCEIRSKAETTKFGKMFK